MTEKISGKPIRNEKVKRLKTKILTEYDEKIEKNFKKRQAARNEQKFCPTRGEKEKIFCAYAPKIQENH